MTTEIQKFAFASNDVRVIMIDDKPWFVATDIAKILGYRDARDALRTVRDTHKGTHPMRTPSGQQDVSIVSEAGLYRLIMRSNRPEAEAFQDWVTDEVLPAIRRTGSYSLAPRSFADTLQLAADQQREIERKEAEIKALAPAAEIAHQWLESDSTVYVVEWAKMLGMENAQIKAYEALRECGVMFKQRKDGGRGEYFNMPKAEYSQYFEIVHEYIKGIRKYVTVTKITPEGQVFLAGVLRENGWI